jgi:alginate O-acetyltransferase complex protein AlgI
MIFTTPWFVLFSGVGTVIFWCLPKGIVRMAYLGALCAFFHTHFAGPAGVIPIVVMMVFTYAAGLSRRSWALGVAMGLNVLALLFYKYINFLVASLVQPWSPDLASALESEVAKVMPGAPPLAISFFTFEFVHYLYEVRRGGDPIRSPLKFALFSLFFPSLVAGPVKRYQQFLPELESACRRRPSLDDATVGLGRIALGFGKKLFIADHLTLWIEQTHREWDSVLFVSSSIFPAIQTSPLGARAS